MERKLIAMQFGGDVNGNLKRAKLVVEHPDDRPDYIEIEIENGHPIVNPLDEPLVRVSFGDNTHWCGSMSELKAKLCPEPHNVQELTWGENAEGLLNALSMKFDRILYQTDPSDKTLFI